MQLVVLLSSGVFVIAFANALLCGRPLPVVYGDPEDAPEVGLEVIGEVVLDVVPDANRNAFPDAVKIEGVHQLQGAI